MLMKTKRVLFATVAILFAFGWQVSMRAQDIPANYIQNPNMEHELNAIFWYGSCCDGNGSNGVAAFPSRYMSDADSHSGNSSFYLPSGTYVWVSYPVRGQEEKKMKASFWYKGYFDGYWNFIYRDVGMTFEDLHPTLAEYVGADSSVWGGEGQDAMQFLYGGEDGYTEDWTYFEFVWDMPGTIPGWGNTSMWHSPTHEAGAAAYVDDLYYGEWFDAQYMGEEPFDFINGDFEASELNIEWLVNLQPWDAFGKDDFVTIMENHTEAGLQSLRLQDYLSVSIDTADMVMPYDSINIDTASNNRNVTYYLPALGAEGEDMEISFWYKGNDATLSLEFYDDYGVTTDAFPLPDGAMLVADSANPVYELDTLSMTIDTLEAFIDTLTVVDPMDDEVLMMYIDTMMLKVDTTIAWQDFDDEENLKVTPTAWVWSGSNNWAYDAWVDALSQEEAWSSPNSLWLPGDPNWGGGEGDIAVNDSTSYIFEFMFKGKMQFILMLGANLKYDLVNDPDGIVPNDPMIDSVNADAIYWGLESDYWRKFRFEFTTGSWLADSSIDAPATLYFDFIGTYDAADVGYMDDFMVATATDADPDVIDTLYVVRKESYTIEVTYDIDTVSTTYSQMMASWMLPAVADWTEWTLDWTNPSTDIGGTLTLHLDNDMTDMPDIIIPNEKEGFDDESTGWTYFDDFVYGVAEPKGIDRNRVQYDLKTYPNPARDVLYLSITIPLNRVDVYNSLGQLQMHLDHPDRVLNVGGLGEGIYFINATDEQGVVHKAKFVKR